jgi:hypothetical protein
VPRHVYMCTSPASFSIHEPLAGRDTQTVRDGVPASADKCLSLFT